MFLSFVAALLGRGSGFLRGWFERFILAVTDLSLALPWLFLLLTVRAILPLDVPPMVSVVIAFLMMGLLGWQASVRVICAATRGIKDSDFLLLARSTGCQPARLLLRYVVPNLRPLFYAQFLISIPLFILTEANLSILGLGVMEPMPSWGNLLRGFEDFSTLSANPLRLVPLVLLVIVVMCFQLVLPSQEVTQCCAAFGLFSLLLLSCAGRHSSAPNLPYSLAADSISGSAANPQLSIRCWSRKMLPKPFAI